jgi:ubiquinone/menaquinone biosynthesis C-methylase UbiE
MKRTADYDIPGHYNQNAINGFDDGLIERMFDVSDLEHASVVLDAMAGNGNLSLSLYDYCQKKNIKSPNILLFELSKVQAELAEDSLQSFPAEVVQGNILEMKQHPQVPSSHFDRVMLKSATHEIPADQQQMMYENILNAIKPGGRFVNLGMIFEDDAERDEARGLARVKDTLAGMHGAAMNRHFLTESEMNSFLKQAGFKHIQHLDRFDYRIHSSVVAKYYFRTRQDEVDYQEKAQSCQLLQERHRLLMEDNEHLFLIPGRITVAKRATVVEENLDTFRLYPMDFLRKVRVHQDMLERASCYIHRGSSVLDMGCGIGLLAEELLSRKVSYEGLDVHPDLISTCCDRFKDVNHFRFYEEDINKVSLPDQSYDHVVLLNTLNIGGVDPIPLIQKSYQALKKGGSLIVSGPLSNESFQLVEPFILEQLSEVGVSADDPDFVALRQANAKLLTEKGNYWSAEGMRELLLYLGFEDITAVHTDLYHGFAYLLVARK